MRKMVMGMSSALLLTLALAGAALGAGFQNGGFENVNQTNGQNWGQLVPAGQDNVTGWTVTGHSVDIVKRFWPAQKGKYSIDLNGLGAGAISQDLDTIAGRHYFVSFQLAGNPDDNAQVNCIPGSTKSMTVTVDGAQGDDFAFSTAGHSLSDIGWEPTGYAFAAPDGSATLMFRSNNAGSACGPVLDSISVTQVAVAGVGCKNSGWKNLTDKRGNAFRNQGDCVSYFATGERNLANPRD